MEKIFIYNSPVGELTISVTEKKVTGLVFGKFMQSPYPKADAFANKVIKQLDDYFNNKKPIHLPVELTGTDFQVKVWQQAMQIPFGKTVSYIELASLINHPGASRAVGSAMKKAPVPIIIPCHRVIRQDGKICSSNNTNSINVKEFLLKHEGAI